MGVEDLPNHRFIHTRLPPAIGSFVPQLLAENPALSLPRCAGPGPTAPAASLVRVEVWGSLARQTGLSPVGRTFQLAAAVALLALFSFVCDFGYPPGFR